MYCIWCLWNSFHSTLKSTFTLHYFLSCDSLLFKVWRENSFRIQNMESLNASAKPFLSRVGSLVTQHSWVNEGLDTHFQSNVWRTCWQLSFLCLIDEYKYWLLFFFLLLLLCLCILMSRTSFATQLSHFSCKSPAFDVDSRTSCSVDVPTESMTTEKVDRQCLLEETTKDLLRLLPSSMDILIPRQSVPSMVLLMDDIMLWKQALQALREEVRQTLPSQMESTGPPIMAYSRELTSSSKETTTITTRIQGLRHMVCCQWHLPSWLQGRR